MTEGFPSILQFGRIGVSLNIWLLMFLTLKVSKSQKQISKFSFEPKTNDFLCISTLASKMSQLKKDKVVNLTLFKK